MKLKRFAALLLIILSVVFFLASIGGVIGIWVVNQPLTESSLELIDSAQADLELAAENIEAAREQLESAQAQIDIFQGILDIIGLEAVENTQVIADIVVKVEGTITPVLDQAAEGISAVGELFDSLVETIEKVNDLPLVSIEIPGGEAIEELSKSVDDIQNQIADTKSKVESISQLTQETVETLTTGFTNWEALIAKNLSMLEDYRGKIDEYQTRLAHLETNLPKWIDLASISLTVLLIWTAFAQVALFVLSWSFYKGEDLLARWR